MRFLFVTGESFNKYQKYLFANFHFVILETIIFLIIFFYFQNNRLLAQNNTEPDNKPLLDKHSEKKAGAVRQAPDSLFFQSGFDDDFNKPGIPYGTMHSPIQDSMYNRAMRLKIPASVRLQNDIEMSVRKRGIIEELGKTDSWQAALENLEIRPEFLAPSRQEIVQRQEMVNHALYIPYLPNMPKAGLSISPRDLGILLGLMEDVSPVMEFRLDYNEEVEIVIYSVQAVVVATIYRGTLRAGKHKIQWNGRDDMGRPMPAGDYIGEIRVGNTRFQRKRINLP